MHTEIDSLTKWQTLSNITGKSVRYYRVRSAVRAVVATVPLLASFIYALTR